MVPGAEGRMPVADRHGAVRDSKRRKKKPRSRKPWELGSEGEETSDGSSTEKVCFYFSIANNINPTTHATSNGSFENIFFFSYSKLNDVQ